MQVPFFVKGLKAYNHFCQNFGGFVDGEDFFLELGLVIDKIAPIAVLK